MQNTNQLIKWIIAFITFECDVCKEGRVSLNLHLAQTVEGQEGVSLYMCDAVTLGDLSVAQINGSMSVNIYIKLKNYSQQKQNFSDARWVIWMQCF